MIYRARINNVAMTAMIDADNGSVTHAQGHATTPVVCSAAESAARMANANQPKPCVVNIMPSQKVRDAVNT